MERRASRFHLASKDEDRDEPEEVEVEEEVEEVGKGTADDDSDMVVTGLEGVREGNWGLYIL